MLYRQRTLLALLQQLGGKASTLQMMEWAFLLNQETPSQGGKTFYHFVPYQKGPYSFTLSREIESLERHGWIAKTGQNSWCLTPYGQKQELNLPAPIAKDISGIIRQYGRQSTLELNEAVYANYPWFTVNRNPPDERRLERPVAGLAIYTAGYEGKTVDEFLDLLMQSGIYRLIDVRSNPISRRYGFHKSTLQRLCSTVGIDYQHLPALGISSAVRAGLHGTDDYQALFEGYRRDLPNRNNEVEIVSSLLGSQPSVLVCMEANPSCCHRSILAQYLMNIINMPVRHLGYDG